MAVDAEFLRIVGQDVALAMRGSADPTWRLETDGANGKFLLKEATTTVLSLTGTGVTVPGTFEVTGVTTQTGLLSVDDTTDSTSGVTGSIHTDGGLGVVKKLTVGTGVTVDAGGVAIKAGRMTEVLTVVDDDSQTMTLAAADILAGINIHTTVTGASTVTVDTAANIISGVPLTHDGQCVVSYYINDGNQTATFAVASGTAISDVANTVLTLSSATLIWERTSSSAVTLHIIN